MLARFGLAVSCTGIGIILIWLSTLKESREFWTYTSPYPIWFRNLVEVGFYPLLAIESVVYIALSTILIRDLMKKDLLSIPSLLIMGINWLIFLTTVWIVLHDNF